MEDRELLESFVRDRSQGAFGELVRRHVDWVHAAALRQVRDPGLAQDVAQAVFIVLARRAGTIRGNHARVLAAWLFQVTRHAARRAVRQRARRVVHEQKAAAMRPETMDAASAEDDEMWKKVSPLVDEAVGRLPREDREAVLLRFYEKRTFGEVGAALGISEEAARKRVGRAAEKMRGFLTARGVGVPLALLLTMLLGRTALAAPEGVVAACAGAANGVGAAAILANSVLKRLMAVRIAAVAAVLMGLVVVAGVLLWPGEQGPETPSGGAHAGIGKKAAIMVPTKLSIDRTAAGIGVDIDRASMVPADIDVPKDLVTGVIDNVYFHEENMPRVPSNSGLQNGSEFNLGRRTISAELIATDRTYILEYELILFETDVPVEHGWAPSDSARYREIWHRILRYRVPPGGAEAAALSDGEPVRLGVIAAVDVEQHKAQVVVADSARGNGTRAMEAFAFDEKTKFFKEGKPSTADAVLRIGYVIEVPPGPTASVIDWTGDEGVPSVSPGRGGAGRLMILSGRITTVSEDGKSFEFVPQAPSAVRINQVACTTDERTRYFTAERASKAGEVVKAGSRVRLTYKTGAPALAVEIMLEP